MVMAEFVSGAGERLPETETGLPMRLSSPWTSRTMVRRSGRTRMKLPGLATGESF